MTFDGCRAVKKGNKKNVSSLGRLSGRKWHTRCVASEYGALSARLLSNINTGPASAEVRSAGISSSSAGQGEGGKKLKEETLMEIIWADGDPKKKIEFE
jgi:hypothetical protein